MNRKWALAVLILVMLAVLLMTYSKGEDDFTIYTRTMPLFQVMPESTMSVEFVPGKGKSDRLLLSQFVKRDEAGKPANADPVQGAGTFVILSAASSAKLKATRKVVVVMPKGEKRTLPVKFKE